MGQTDLATIAGLYAQMTGVLAGFAFTAVVTITKPPKQRPAAGLADHEREQRTRDSTSILVLLVAFVALLITTLTYSILAGETSADAKPRAATSELIDGVPFGLAVFMLFHGVTRLMEQRRVDRLAVWTARVATVIIVPCLAYYYLVSGTQDTLTAQAHNTAAACRSAALPGHAVAYSVILPIFLTACLTARRWLRPARSYARRLEAVAPVTVLAISIAAAVASSTVENRSPGFLLSPTVLNAYVSGIFFLFAFLATLVAFGYDDGEPTHVARDQAPPLSQALTLTAAATQLPAGHEHDVQPPPEQTSDVQQPGGTGQRGARPSWPTALGIAIGAAGAAGALAAHRRSHD